MPKSIRQLKKELLKSGFTQIQGGKGSHRKFIHDQYLGFVILSGAEGSDAKPYQEKMVHKAIASTK